MFAPTRSLLSCRWPLALCACVASVAHAQQPADSAAPRHSIVVFAEASAREVQFRAQPRIEVHLLGALDSIRVLDRTNLPSPVVVGRTYRDVHVAVEIFGRVTADCLERLLRGGADTTCAGTSVRDSRPARPPGDSTKSTSRSSP